MDNRPVRIFMAEDNGAGVNLVREALVEHHINCEMTVAHDGTNAVREPSDLMESLQLGAIVGLLIEDGQPQQRPRS